MNLAPVELKLAQATARKRKKDGAYPFARLSLASARYLVADAVGRLAATAKRIAARRKEEAEPEG
jgi:hypothetical protein